MKRILLATAAVVAVVAVWIAFTLPPALVVLSPGTSAPAGDGTVSGVLHIHTNRSDGRSSPEDVAKDAARAGLGFIVLTDHGDATRPPDPPVYRSGVLCLDGVEISTTGGHYVAIGLPAAPYPLGGEPRDVVEDVTRLGGFGIAAHPDSPKHDLQWRGWSAPFDGIEVINPDTSWRVHATTRGVRGKLRLFDAILTFPFRSPETIASLLTDAEPLIARWEMLTRTRRVVAVAGTDAHALAGEVPIPSYETSFRMLSVHVRPDRALSGDAAADAAAIVAGLRAGHVYSIVDGFAARPSFEFSAGNEHGTAQAGDELAAGGRVTIRVASNAPPSFTTTVWRGDQVLQTGHHEPSFAIDAPDGAGVYRVEVRASDNLTLPPWLVSNPIYIRAGKAAAPSVIARTAPSKTEWLFNGIDGSAWRVERDEASRGDLQIVAPEAGVLGKGALHVHYHLPDTDAPDNRIALLGAYPGFLTPFDRVTFSARADRPMRVSVQLRNEREGRVEERWQRSVYLDATPRVYTVYFDDLVALGNGPHATPVLEDIPYVSFVVDTTNAAAGAEGEFWISEVGLQSSQKQ